MNGMRALFYICALMSIMPYVHAIDDALENPSTLREPQGERVEDGSDQGQAIEILYSGNYQIRYLNNALALIDCDNEHRLYNLQAAIQSGGFSLPANITNQFIIAADNVQMNLSGHTVQGGIVIAPNKSDITIQNGVVGGRFASSLTNGILVYSGVSNITIKDMQITNAIAGINFNNVTIGSITNCDFSQNTTGVLLQSSSQITVSQSRAMQNVAAGFSLINSSTNCLRDCRALSTGQGNTSVINNTVFGFVSSNGFGNIFERCIANSTQALSTTDYNSVIAGFALRGTEACSKIIECEASNAQTNITGVTVPYGILLEAQFSALVSITSVNPGDGASGDAVLDVSWSPDGCYLAVGGQINSTTGNDLFVYKFNYVSQILTQIISTSPSGMSDQVRTVAWSPNGRYLAVGGDIPGNSLYVYSFDRDNETLSLLQSTNPGGADSDVIFSVDWSPDGMYLAVGGNITGDALYLYKFDSVAQTISQVDSVDTGGAGDVVNILAWSPDGIYLAVGGGLTTDDLRVYRFDRASQTLIQVISVNPGGGGVADGLLSLDWSFDGKYLAVGGLINYPGGNALYIYRFTGTALTEVATALGGAGYNVVFSAMWSSDGRYLAVAGDFPSNDLLMYSFDRGSSMLFQRDSANPDGGGISDTLSIASWSPDGRYLAVGGQIAGATNNDLFIFQALTFPSKNVINGNTVYCNSSGSTPSGIGISGSSIANMIIQNIAYANPLVPFMVDQNYAFVTNVFNQQFGQGPTALQNISLAYQEVIQTPADLVLLAEQIQSELYYQVGSSIAALASKVDSILSTTLLDMICSATAIYQINIPTTLTASGVYCLTEDVTDSSNFPSITIQANNVTLDLNNHTLIANAANGISSDGFNNIIIRNGTVLSTDFIFLTPSGTALSLSNGSNITVDGVTAFGNAVGILCQAINGGLICNSTVSDSPRGVQLFNATKITVENVRAKKCSLRGFDLVTSQTCCLQNCKALSTGVGNAQTSDQTIVGFYSSRGSGNIFENCIANGTQGLSVTDPDSIVAGFMLTGTEHNTKIINCEASNSMVGQTSYTVPYGILLDNQFTALNGVASGVATTISATGVRNIRWSPNGQFLAVVNQSASTSVPCFSVLEFDRIRRTFNTIASFTNANSISEAVSWSPDGNYIAVGMGYLQIYKIDQQTKIVSLIYQININDAAIDSLRAIAWSPNGQYLAVGGSINGTNVNFYMFKFDPVQQTLTQQASLQIGTTTFKSVAWTLDGTYFALGADVTTGTTFYIYQWDPINNTLTQKDSHSLGSGIYDLKWSSDGRYLAVGSDIVYVYTINKSTGVVTLAASVNPPGNDVEGVDWSADGQYLAIGDDVNFLVVYYFDRQTNTLTEVSDFNPEGNSFVVYAVAWDPAGNYLAVGRRRATASYNMLLMYTAFDFPTNCVIKDNLAYCNAGGIQSRGVGIAGSSISNMIVGNTAYSNPVTPFMVNENYQFVTNVFTQMFQNSPSTLQNISLGSQEPIVTPLNEAFLAQQLNAKVDDLTLCSPTSLSSADFIGTGTISITQNGTYCLAEDFTGDISITTTCVSLDLNNRCLTGVIFITTSDNVSVYNGFINPAARTSNSQAVAAVNVSNTSLRTTLSDLYITCANSTGDGINGRSGISIAGIDTMVRNCTINASDGSAGVAGSGGNGGHGIELSSTFTAVRAIITNSLIWDTGDGGSVAAAFPAGSGGHGIFVPQGTNTTIDSVIVFKTGIGGNGSGSVGGNGGNGIKVNVFAVDTQITNCVFRNTGAPGSGGGTPVGGKAVDDDVTLTANLSQVFSNFAHNIASATKFDLQAANIEKGILIPNPPGTSVFNILANVFTS